MKLFRKKKTVRTQLASSRIPDIPFSALPKPIARTLRAAGARIRRIVMVRGIFAVLAAALISILCIMAVDAMVTILNPWVRWGLWACGVAAVVIVARTALFQPLSRKLTPALLAGLIERNHPELEERLSTVVELMASPDSLAEGSDLLMKVVTEAAVEDTGKLSMKREFTARTVRPRFLLAAGALGVLLVLFTFWRAPVQRLFLRAIAPAAEVDNVYAENLRVLPGSAVVLRGAPFAVELAVLGGFPGQAYVRTGKPDGTGRESSERMVQLSADEEDVRRYRHDIGAVEGSFRYRVVCGSAVTRHYDVLAVEPPDFTNATATLEFPAYTATSPRTLPPDSREIAAVAGTRVTLRATPLRPLHGALLLPDGADRPAEPDFDGDLEWTFELAEGGGGTWGIRVWDDNGFTNSPAAFPLSVVPDAAPAFTFDSPTNRTFELPAYGRIPLQYTIEEDFGFSAPPQLQYSVGGGRWENARTLPVEESALEGVWSGEGDASLGGIPVGNALNVRFRVAVSDNYPTSLGGPHVAYSPVLTVRLDGDRRTLGHQRLDAAKDSAAKSVDDVRKSIAAALQKAKEAKQEAAAKRDQTAVDRIAQSKEKIGEGIQTAEKLVRDALSGPLDALAPEVKELLETKLKPALEAADEAAATTPEERIPAIDELIRRLSEAEAGVAELNKELQKAYEEMKKAEEMAEMADRQKALAEEAAKKDSMTLEERAAWERKQAELEKELERRLAELEKQGNPLAEQQKEAAKAADEMEKLAELQKKLADLEKKLRDKESGARKEAEDELRDMTKNMPKDASAADRLEKLQEDVFDEARELQEKIAALQARLDALDNPDGKNPLDQAAQDAMKAQQEAQQALDAFQSNPDWDGQRDENAEQRQAEGDPNAQRNWDGQKDPNAQDEQKDGQWDPNAKREWDGKKDPNAQDEPNKDGQWDPNAQRQWDGKKDPNAKDEPNKDGQWDPNRKKDPWDGKIDPNALMNQAAQDMQKAADALKDAQEQMQRQGEQMQQQMQQQAQQAQQAMQQAQQAMQQQGQQQQQQGQQQQQQGQQQQQQGQQQQQQGQQQQQQQGQQQQQQQGQQQQQQQGQQQQQQQGQQQQQQQGQSQSQNEAQQQAQQAADAMQQMAEQMQKQSGSKQQNQQQQQKNQQQNQKNQGEQESESSGEHKEGSESKKPPNQDGVPMLFQNLGISEADWFKMKGDVGSERFDSALDKVPPEYRDLVKAYFQGLNELQ